MPLTPQELVHVLVDERIRYEKQLIDEQRSSGGDVFLPQEFYSADQRLGFPALGWRNGRVVSVRPGGIGYW